MKEKGKYNFKHTWWGDRLRGAQKKIHHQVPTIATTGRHHWGEETIKMNYDKNLNMTHHATYLSNYQTHKQNSQHKKKSIYPTLRWTRPPFSCLNPEASFLHTISLLFSHWLHSRLKCEITAFAQNMKLHSSFLCCCCCRRCKQLTSKYWHSPIVSTKSVCISRQLPLSPYNLRSKNLIELFFLNEELNKWQNCCLSSGITTYLRLPVNIRHPLSPENEQSKNLNLRKLNITSCSHLYVLYVQINLWKYQNSRPNIYILWLREVFIPATYEGLFTVCLAGFSPETWRSGTEMTENQT